MAIFRVDKMRPYTQIATGLRFPPKKKVVIFYFSENSNFLDDYPKLGIRRVDVRYALVPVTKIPRTRLAAEVRKAYKGLGIMSYSTNMKFPENRNLYYDLSQYLVAIDVAYSPKNYRQRAGFLIKNILFKSINSFSPEYQKIFMYNVDATEPMNQFRDRKIFPILQMIKSEGVTFDHLLFGTIDESSTKYRLLVQNKEFHYQKLLTYIRKVKPIDMEREEQENINAATDAVMAKVSKELPPKSQVKVRDAVKNFFGKDKKTAEKVVSKEIKSDEMEQVATASILFNTSGDLDKSKRIAKSIPREKRIVALKAVDKAFIDELLKPQPTVSTTEDVVVQSANVPKMVDKKSPEHLFQKRQVDFTTNLKKDMTNVFRTLEKKEIPVRVKSMSISDKPTRRGELDKSDISIMTVVLTDKYGNTHTVEMEMPKIDPTSGTFRIHGRRKCLINQMIQNPITFPKVYESKFESIYSLFRIYSKRGRKKNYLEIFMTYRLPFLAVLSFAFGFKETMRLYGVKYKVSETKVIKKTEFGVRINETEAVFFEGANTEIKEELCQSLIQAKPYLHNVEAPFPDKQYWNSLIIAMTGRIASTFLITSNVENIVDPIAKQVLMNKQLPTDLHMIMKYMATGVIEGRVEDRNDLSHQRIRASEVLAHFALKQVLAAYTEYKEQVLAGNTKANLRIVPGKLLSDFINSQIVVDMEYVNPIEEMAVMTRTTPIGRNIGGIPDKRAMQGAALNVHRSYFGNVDPLDTPESDSIGITQHLTVNALITSARGLFQTKPATNTEHSGMLSVSSAMIPFIENNDGVRIMMAANQSRQAVPLKNPESPDVQSGYESILPNVLSDVYVKRSPCAGKVKSVTEDRMIITCKAGRAQGIDLSPVHLRSGTSKDTLSVFKPTVKAGGTVKQHQIVAEGSALAGGTMALGRSLLTAMMPYKGYNFEDAMVISDSLVSGDKLTSLHGLTEDALISKDDRLISIIDVGASTKKGEPLLRRTIGEIEELLGYEEDEGEVIAGGLYTLKSPGGKVVEIEVFSNVGEAKFPTLKSLIARTRRKYGLAAKEKFTVRGETIKGVMVRFKIEQELQIGLGDKLCNRFGGKGIVSLIESESEMPRTPWGERVEIILNPLGIIGRMNLGQLYELYCGLVSRELAKKFLEIKKQDQIAALMKRVTNKLDTSKNKEYSNALANGIKKLSPAKFKQMLHQINQKKAVPIIIPPFKAPSHREIQSVLKMLGLKPGYKLFIPEYNTKTRSDVPVGYMYIYKLEHIGDLKIHSRSTGPVKPKTLQPTAGKRRGGGQRMGEAETYSLISYNCPALLAEMMGPLSDDHITKNEIVSEIVQTGGAGYREPKINPAGEVLESYFTAMMLSGR